MAASAEFEGLIAPEDLPGSANGSARATARFLDPPQSRSHAFGNSEAFLFGDPGRNRDHQFARRSGRAEVFLSETNELNAVRGQPLDVIEGFGNALAGQAIKCPNEKQIEAALGDVRKHPPEFAAVRFAAALVIDVLVGNFPALPLSEIAQLGKLVVYLLPTVRCADAGIDGYSNSI
jgi:hypothetical protein